MVVVARVRVFIVDNVADDLVRSLDALKAR